MEITIYYGAEMPQRIKSALMDLAGLELSEDFELISEFELELEEDVEESGGLVESDSYGVYFGGDLKEETEMRAEMKESYTDAFCEGYFTMDKIAKAVVIIEILCPNVEWKVTNYENAHIKGQLYKTWKRFFENEGAYLLKKYDNFFQIG